MDARFIETLKNQLIVRRAEVIRQLSEHATTPELERQGKDIGDEALSSTLSDVQSSLDQTEINELNLIDDALMRMERNEYGMCVECDEPISQRRLEYSPYVNRCIVCQEAFEREKEKEMGDRYAL